MNIIQYNIRGLFNNFEDLEILERDLEVDRSRNKAKKI